MSPSHPIGDRVRLVREYAVGLTPAELSDLASLSPSHVGMIERGAVKSPAAATLVPIARVLGCSVEWLVSGAGESPSAESVRAAVQQARQSKQASEPKPAA